jgi:hypothetical protein
VYIIPTISINPLNGAMHFNVFGALAKLQKANISFAMTVCPSVRMEKLGFHYTDFHEILYLRILFNICLSVCLYRYHLVAFN